MSQNCYYFHSAIAGRIIDAMDRNEAGIGISVDLNLSLKSFSISGNELILDTDHRLKREDLERIAAKKDRIFLFEDHRMEILESRGDGYYKLVPTDKAPLLEISGVKMHISKGTDPFKSAGQMAAQVVKKGDRVLDTCGGLGYAATAALTLGAREVVSVEMSATVMALREKNPWSQRIYGPGIQLVHGDVNEYIGELATQSFDAVIHDPPRFSLAGELYGERFYREIHRVLKPRGALFHYTGNPHLLKRGSSFVDQAAKRLKLAGFTKVSKVSELMGLLAKK